ncbi:MAG: caspase family protein, partial [Myxococcales bacterium]|nr:caspase family protein [Myxococcales bacterium]
LRFGAPEATRAPARAPAARPALDFGTYHALVIGNEAYRHLPRLQTAGEDARAIARVLADRYGFEVELALDASRYEILSKLNALRARLTERDNLVVYYAGHGELDRANMRGHWLPIDAEPDSSANWISNVAITDVLNAMAAKHVLVIADSCYSGSLTRSSLARLEAGSTPQARLAWQRAMLGKRSRTALTSGGLQPVLDAGGGAHSIFARALLDVLERNEEVLEGQAIHQELAARVVWAAEDVRFEQTPQYAPIRFAGHEAGEFFFVPRGGSAQLDAQAGGRAVAGEIAVAEEALVLGEGHPPAR